MTSSMPLDPGTFAGRINRLLPFYFASSRERLKEFLSLYLEQSAEYADKIEAARISNDSKAIRAAIHAWRPAMPMLGLDELHESAESIETAIDDGLLEGAALDNALNEFTNDARACAALVRSYRREL